MDDKLQKSVNLDILGEQCLSYLISDPMELENFMQQAGYNPERLRKNIGNKSLNIGMLDYFANNEQALLSLCATANINVKDFMNFWQQLNHEK